MLISKFSTCNVHAEIKAMEKALNIELPAQLKLFLQKYNGGESPRTNFVCGDISSDVVAFYGVGNVKYTYNDVQLVCRDSLKYLPIAFDSFGNSILILIGAGSVHFFDHETEKISKVADDLRIFVAKCASKPINAASRKSIQEREADLISRGRGHIVTDALRKMWQDELDKYGVLTQEEVSF